MCLLCCICYLTPLHQSGGRGAQGGFAFLFSGSSLPRLWCQASVLDLKLVRWRQTAELCERASVSWFAALFPFHMPCPKRLLQVNLPKGKESKSCSSLRQVEEGSWCWAEPCSNCKFTFILVPGVLSLLLPVFCHVFIFSKRIILLQGKNKCINTGKVCCNLLFLSENILRKLFYWTL